MIGIVVSRADCASEHVCDHLLDLADWTERTDTAHSDGEGGGTVYRTDGFELREFDDLHLYLDDVADVFEADLDVLVFASRHSGETGRLLTAHHTGNFGPADHGGEANELARACPNAHSAVLDALAQHAPDDYEVGMECTHHGPSAVGVPSMFVEVGSAQPQWDDPDAARAVARSILDLRDIESDAEPEASGIEGSTGAGGTVRRHLVGFGGGHYAPRFTRIVRETDWSVGHLAADWGLAAMGDPSAHRDLLTDALTESAAQFALVDGDYPDLCAELEDLGYRVVSETWLREVDDVPLALVDRLEERLSPIAAGLRFGEPATTADPECSFEVVDLPDELLAEAQGIDQAATRDVVATRTLAFETNENGNRVTGRGAVGSGTDYDVLIDGIIDLLRDTYESVEREGDTVIARKSAFDPETARDLGVPEGPKFGRLADGDSVDVRGETIHPDQVRTERVHRFPV